MDTLPLTSIGAAEIGNHSRLVQGLMAKSLNVPTFLPSEFRRFAQRWASSDFKTHRGTSGYRLPDLVEIVRQLERDSRVTRDGPALEEEYEVCPSDEEIERLIKAHHWIPEFLMNPSPIRAQAIAYASAHPDTASAYLRPSVSKSTHMAKESIMFSAQLGSEAAKSRPSEPTQGQIIQKSQRSDKKMRKRGKGCRWTTQKALELCYLVLTTPMRALTKQHFKQASLRIEDHSPDAVWEYWSRMHNKDREEAMKQFNLTAKEIAEKSFQERKEILEPLFFALLVTLEGGSEMITSIRNKRALTNPDPNPSPQVLLLGNGSPQIYVSSPLAQQFSCYWCDHTENTKDGIRNHMDKFHPK